MANLMDYLVWRGDFGFDPAPWNEADALLMANLSYLDFHGTEDMRGWTLAEAKRLELLRESRVANFEGRKAQFEAMAESHRFGGIRMHHFITLTDPEQKLQFSATCYDMPDGTLCVGFRGTDGTLVGWREDFDMSYQAAVPAQVAAVMYLEKAAEMDDRPIRLVGHSKGGNLAAYAAACSAPEVQDRLTEIYSFDGPGMCPEVFQSEGYARVVDRIQSFVPQTSIVGMMMEYHRKYTVVRSDASGITQHDPLTWQVYGPRFETVEKVDANAEMISDTLHDLLNRTERDERAGMVDAMFNAMEAVLASDARGNRKVTVARLAMATRNLNPEARRAVVRMVGLLLSLGIGNLTERYIGKRRGAPAEEKPEMKPDENWEEIAAEMDRADEQAPEAESAGETR